MTETAGKIDRNVVIRDVTNTIMDTVNLNRRERRALKAAAGRLIPHMGSVKTVVPVTQLLEHEDDLSLYQRELNLYQRAQKMDKRALEVYEICQSLKMPEDYCRKYLVDLGKQPKGIDCPQLTSFTAAPHRVRKRLMGMLSDISGMGIVIDEDSESLQKILSETGIPTRDILEEALRARNVTIELLKMQIDWLKTHPQQPILEEHKISTPEMQPTDKAVQTNLPMQEAVKPFILSNWRVFWTKVPWSSDANHLIPIPTTSFQEALVALKEVGRGEISIKPASVIRALEFYLQKDILQRAMSARLRYVPNEIRDWAKIKRGNNRIFFNAAEETGEAVFFVGGRDNVYNSLSH